MGDVLPEEKFLVREEPCDDEKHEKFLVKEEPQEKKELSEEDVKPEKLAFEDQKLKFSEEVVKKPRVLYKKNGLDKWTKAFMQARKNLGIKGFVACKKGTKFYKEAMKLYRK